MKEEILPSHYKQFMKITNGQAVVSTPDYTVAIEMTLNESWRVCDLSFKAIGTIGCKLTIRLLTPSWWREYFKESTWRNRTTYQQHNIHRKSSVQETLCAIDNFRYPRYKQVMILLNQERLVVEFRLQAMHSHAIHLSYTAWSKHLTVKPSPHKLEITFWKQKLIPGSIIQLPLNMRFWVHSDCDYRINTKWINSYPIINSRFIKHHR